MSIRQIKRLLPIGLPFAGFLIAVLCGRTIGGAVGIVLLTTLTVAFLAAMPLLGFVFVPILGLYFSRESEKELQDADNQFFLLLGIPATLAIAGLLSHLFSK